MSTTHGRQVRPGHESAAHRVLLEHVQEFAPGRLNRLGPHRPGLFKDGRHALLSGGPAGNGWTQGCKGQQRRQAAPIMLDSCAQQDGSSEPPCLLPDEVAMLQVAAM